MEENESVEQLNRSRLKSSKNDPFNRTFRLQGLMYKTLAFIAIASSTINVVLGSIANSSGKTNVINTLAIIENDSDYLYDSMDNSIKRIYQNLTINTPIEKRISNGSFTEDSDNGIDIGSSNANHVNNTILVATVSNTSNLFKSNGTEALSTNLTTTLNAENEFNSTMPTPPSTSSVVNDQNNYWALSALFLVAGTAAGNILVCLAIAWEHRLQNVTNYFLMSLAITDLMVAILVMPFGILSLVKGESFLIFFSLQISHSNAKSDEIFK